MRKDLEDTFFFELKKLYKLKLLSSDAYMFALEQERFKNQQSLNKHNLINLSRFHLN